MYLSLPLPRLIASHQGHNKEPGSREEATAFRTRSTHGFSGTRGFRKAHSGAQRL